MRYVYLQRPPSSPVRGCVTPVPAYLDPHETNSVPFA
jgi:hypothetical protein